MERDLLTTREVAKMLGVGTTSIKRWADSGLLRCVKTPGGHRRFPREAVESFHVTDQGGAETVQSRVDSWMTRLRDGMGTNDIVKQLHKELRSQGDWYEVADSLSMVLEEIGRGWARGDLSVIQEHIISERLMRAFARVAETLSVPGNARTCMLMAAEGEEHTLGLSLAELCLREAGWNTSWVGRKTPVHIACEHILGRDVDMVAVSASEYLGEASVLVDQVERLGRACERRGIPLVLGGMGLWPAEPRYGRRIYTFAELRAFLDSGAR